jgi:hypothetical protein
MEAQTYTSDGRTEYELVYDEIPDEGNVYVVEADADDGARSTAVPVDEFESEWEEHGENEKTDAYLRERARNGHGIQ